MPSGNIWFLGGIHGVGKTTVAKKLCDKFDIEYLSASRLINWSNAQEKQVADISANQDVLIKVLHAKCQPGKKYLLDGHYCLFDKNGSVSRIPFQTFEAINPISLLIIVEDTDTIKARLEQRDDKLYDSTTLNKMQQEELAYATELSKNLNVGLQVGEEEILVSIGNAVERGL